MVSACFELIADGISATVRGRDIGKGLCKIVDAVARKRFNSWEQFAVGVQSWLDEQIEIVNRRYDDEAVLEQRCSSLCDQAECVRIIHARSNASNAEALKAAIEEIFSDDRASVMLSSIHKAKGLETSRVFILNPERLGRGFGKAPRPWMLEQERNLAYVAFTRAMDTLVLVKGET